METKTEETTPGEFCHEGVVWKTPFLTTSNDDVYVLYYLDSFMRWPVRCGHERRGPGSKVRHPPRSWSQEAGPHGATWEDAKVVRRQKTGGEELGPWPSLGFPRRRQAGQGRQFRTGSCGYSGGLEAMRCVDRGIASWGAAQ